MSSASESISALGGDTNLVEVLYLDRGRLYSYAAQLEDGLTVIRRRLTEGGTSSTRHQPVTETGTETQATRRAGGGISGALRLDGDHSKKESSFERSTSIQETKQDADWLSTSEDKAEHDNLLTYIERQLTERGALRDFEGGITTPGLYRFRGPMKFFDWDIIGSMMNQLAPVISAMSAFASQPLPPTIGNMGDAISALFKVIGINGMQVNMHSMGQMVSAPVNTEFLTLSQAQLRAVYLRDTPTFGTLIAYAAPEAEPELDFPSFAPFADTINFDDMLTPLLGNGLRVVPLAIYLPVDVAPAEE